MDKFLRTLREFLEEKKAASDINRRTALVSEQLLLISSLEHEEQIEGKVVQKIISAIRQLELHKEFNISLQDFERILREKHVEENFYHMFIEDIKRFMEKLHELKSILQQQEHASSEKLWEEEERIYGELEGFFRTLNYSESGIEQYFHDMKSLSYKRKYIRSGQIISRMFGKALARIHVEGIENIPKRGPCILISRHYHGLYDIPILYSVIDRKLFFITATDLLVFFPFVDRLYLRLGALPIKRDDSLFGKRVSFLGIIHPKKETIDRYPSSNSGAIRKTLTHLKYGDAIVIFPSGDAKIIPQFVKSSKVDFLPPQGSFVLMALMAKKRFGIDVPVIPIGLNYTGKILPGIVNVRIGPPVYLDADILNAYLNPDKEMTNAQLKVEITKRANYMFDMVIELSQ